MLLVFVTLFFTIFPLNCQIFFYTHFFCNFFFSANILGITCSLYFFLQPGEEKYARCVTVDQLKSKKFPPLAHASPNALETFFLGRRWNPRIIGVDVKMLLYAIGAIQLQLNIFSFVISQREKWGGKVSVALTVYTVLFTWFLAEYMLGEYVHLYTYDLFAEKIGFKLVWGCLTFYPFFYCIGGYYLVSVPVDVDISILEALCISALFFTGWGITRGANMQKFMYRTRPDDKTFLFGIVEQKVVPGSRILCSGWWGVSRHFNYFGEIIQVSFIRNNASNYSLLI